MLRFLFAFKCNPFNLACHVGERVAFYRSLRMRYHHKTVLFFLALATGVSAQGVPAGVTHTTVRQAMGERDKGKENEVAKLFDNIRSGLKSPQLRRIEYRDLLEEQVCTIALVGTLARRTEPDTFALYKTLQPESITPELKRVASFDALYPKNRAGYRRYSVAAWRTKDPQTQETVYWVGVELYWSAAIEFFDYHFSNGIYAVGTGGRRLLPNVAATEKQMGPTDKRSSAYQY